MLGAMKDDVEKLWLTPEHFAQLVDRTPRTVHKWCRRVKIPSIMIGHSVRIPRSALARFEERANANVTEDKP